MRPLRTEAFARRIFYTAFFAHIHFVSFFTRTLWHAEAFTHRSFWALKLLHEAVFFDAGALICRSLYTQKFLHTDAFWKMFYCAEKLLQTDAFTHRSFCTQCFFLHRSFSQNGFYTENIFQREAFAQSNFSHATQKHLHEQPLDRAAFPHRSFNTGNFCTHTLSHTWLSHRSFCTEQLYTEML